MEPFTIVKDPAAWKVADWQLNKDWVYRLTDSDLAELETAVNSALDQGIPTEVRPLPGCGLGAHESWCR